MTMTWNDDEHYPALGSVSPSSLVPTRLQHHWACQILESAARAYVEPEPGDVHTSLDFLGPDWLATHVMTTPSGDRRAAIDMARSAIMVVGAADHEIFDEHVFSGSTLEQSRAWLESRLGISPLVLPDYDLPEHALNQGARFGPETSASAEIVRWFKNAHLLFQQIADQDDGASPVRTWPHHFDMATLIAVGDPQDAHAESSRSINVGFSPGDGNYDEPYFYVSAWPYPDGLEGSDGSSLPPLGSGGHWHTAGFVAAILTGSRVVESTEPKKQFRMATGFLDSALGAARSLVSD